jgi:hypothetical protein
LTSPAQPVLGFSAKKGPIRRADIEELRVGHR